MTVPGLKPYPAYKPSGVEWLGDVPAHWEVRRLGQIGSFSRGRGGSKDDERSVGVSCVRYGDLYTTHQYAIEESRSFVSPDRAAEYTQIKFGDLLFAASGESIDEIGKSAVNLIASDARCGGDIILFRPRRKVEVRYLGYASDSHPAMAYKATMGRGFTVVHIYTSELKYLSLALPPLLEQAAIARYLEHADRRIRRYVAAKERLVKLLEEYRQTLIRDAVTGQVDVRTGQPYPAYKPSGVEWLGDIPAHWEVRRSKRVFRRRNELARPDDIQLSSTQAYGVIAQADYEEKTGRKVTKVLRHLTQRRHVEVDDFVISMRSFQGGLERARRSGCIRSSYIVLQATVTDLSVAYFSHLFKSAGYIKALQSTANFIRDGQDLNFENFCRVDLPFPPRDEQQQIGQTVDSRIAHLSMSIELFRRQIGLLREYRTRLIADAVTGKVDVREAVADIPAPDRFDLKPLDAPKAEG